MNHTPPRKILFVVTKSNWGGAQQYVYTLATRLTQAGTDVVVALGGTGEARAAAGLLETRLSEAGVRTIFLSSFMRDISVFREIKAFFELLHILRAEKPDVLHLNSSKAAGIGAVAGRIARVPHIIVTAHGWAHKELRPPFSRALIWLASYATVICSHTTIVLSHRQFEDAPAPGLRRKLIIIPNGIGDFPLLDKDAARAGLTKLDARIGSFKRLIVSTSELHRNKGLDILLSAFARIARHHTDTALILIHSGEEHDQLVAHADELHIRDRVFFLGFVKEARSFLRAADIFALPSRKEGLPFGLLEAGRAGVPVVASAVGAVPELIENNVTGVLVPSGNTFALAAELDRLLSDARRSSEFGNALRKRIEMEYSEASMVERTFALYGI